MKWTDLKIAIISYLIPLIAVLYPVVRFIIKMYSANKKLMAQLKLAENKLDIDTTNSILEESRELREEFKKERNFLKDELEKERDTANKLSNTIITINTKYEQSERQVKILIEILKKTFGMSDIANVNNIKIAILEDNDGDVVLMKRLLKKNAINNTSYYKDADLFIKEMDDDTRILIIDHLLIGQMNGIEVIRKINTKNEYRYIIMLSGYSDFEVLYNFNRLVIHGIYILKGRPDSDDLLIKKIREAFYFINIFSEASKEIISS